MVYSFKGKAKDLLNDLQDFINNGNKNIVPCETKILENFGNSLKSLGVKNFEIYTDLEGVKRLKYEIGGKVFIVSIEELYN